MEGSARPHLIHANLWVIPGVCRGMNFIQRPVMDSTDKKTPQEPEGSEGAKGTSNGRENHNPSGAESKVGECGTEWLTYSIQGELDKANTAERAELEMFRIRQAREREETPAFSQLVGKYVTHDWFDWSCEYPAAFSAQEFLQTFGDLDECLYNAWIALGELEAHERLCRPSNSWVVSEELDPHVIEHRAEYLRRARSAFGQYYCRLISWELSDMREQVEEYERVVHLGLYEDAAPKEVQDLAAKILSGEVPV